MSFRVCDVDDPGFATVIPSTEVAIVADTDGHVVLAVDGHGLVLRDRAEVEQLVEAIREMAGRVWPKAAA